VGFADELLRVNLPDHIGNAAPGTINCKIVETLLISNIIVVKIFKYNTNVFMCLSPHFFIFGKFILITER
jgi:hypothetical protein